LSIDSDGRSGLSRRDFLKLTGAGAGALAIGDYGLAHATGLASPAGGVTHGYTLEPGPARFNLGGRHIQTIAYNQVLPGPMIRAKRGERLQVVVNNHLKSDTSVHWHGIPIINKMDGVPGVTQAPIAAGAGFVYDFPIKVSGTYWYHSHNEIQLDRGLYGPLIIDEPNETLSYDREAILAFDDWHDLKRAAGSSFQNDAYYCDLKGIHDDLSGGNMAPAQPARYPLHLVNGRPPGTPTEIAVKRGDVIRLRLINAAAGTVYRIALEGHRMRVTHTDGLPVKPVDVDTLDIGMAERYDVLVYANNPGVWQLAAEVNGEGVRTRAVLRYAGHHSKAPAPRFKPKSLNGKLLDYTMLNAAQGLAVPPSGKPDLTVPITLNNRFGSFWMTYNGTIPDASKPLHIPLGTHVRFLVSNSGSTEPHPIHLHGHSFRLSTGSHGGPMKDTAIIQPFHTWHYDWVADNPGLWMFHCHNLYHMLAGMMIILDVS